MKYEINSKQCEITEFVEHCGKLIPVVNIPMMSDEQWNELAKRKSPL